jgi:hypothetical protein
MKVAICISGHVRNFEDCKSSFVSSIVEKYNKDSRLKLDILRR